MTNFSELVSVPVITAICYGIIEIYKQIANNNKKCLMLIPLIGAGIGIILGILAFYCAKSIIPTDNILTAILIGLTSGLAATGTHQIFKQISKSTTGKAQEPQEPQETQQPQPETETKTETQIDQQKEDGSNQG